MENKLKVLFVAAECSPIIKVGGLGDVAGELPLKLRELGVDVRIVIPSNRDIDIPTEYRGDFPIKMGLRDETCIIRQVINAAVPTYLVDNYHYLGRSGVYGHQDDPERFAFFSLSVFELLKRFDFKPDVVHLNDWHTAPTAMLLRENEREHPELSDIAIVYTIHNLEYQGVSDKRILSLLGIKEVVFKTDKVEYFGCFNAMKAGISYSDIINSVSVTSAKQMMTREYGFGLEGTLSKRKTSIRGVVNGINTDIWNPETDGAVFVPYSKDDLQARKENKSRLQDYLGLKKSDKPLFAVVSRLVLNKGLDLMEGAAEKLLKEGCQFVLLGSGDKFYENAFLRIMERYPGDASVNLEFNNEKARRIYAGSDVLLMPSRHEPCGISQLIAMRYGSIPLVYKTGGLCDTVVDEATNKGKGTGFFFKRYSREALEKAIDYVIKAYRKKEAWEGLIQRAMSCDFSWQKSALEYIAIYKEAQEANRERKEKGRKNPH